MTRVSLKTLHWIPFTTETELLASLFDHSFAFIRCCSWSIWTWRTAAAPPSHPPSSPTPARAQSLPRFSPRRSRSERNSPSSSEDANICVLLSFQNAKNACGKFAESLVSSAGLNLPPMPLAWVPTWGSRGENSTARVENYKVRMRRVAGWWMEWGEVMQMADEQQGCRLRGRVGKYEMQESEGIINWTRFLFFLP